MCRSDNFIVYSHIMNKLKVISRYIKLMYHLNNATPNIYQGTNHLSRAKLECPSAPLHTHGARPCDELDRLVAAQLRRFNQVRSFDRLQVRRSQAVFLRCCHKIIPNLGGIVIQFRRYLIMRRDISHLIP